MRIEAVTVCLHYDDFLEPIIRTNQSLFDDWVVVTEASDRGTHAVCERYGVRAINCPYFRKGGAAFDKSRAINVGLAHLSLSDWVVHLDADISLPRDTRKQLDNVDLDPECLYGIDRVDCPSWEEWHGHCNACDPYDKHYFTRPPRGWKLGSRLRHYDFGGWTPIGFFQLWNRKSNVLRYPVVKDANVEHCDVLFGLQWPRAKRVLIPELLGVHIGTGGPNMGANWHGRKTPRFGPCKPCHPPCHPPEPPCHPKPYCP